MERLHRTVAPEAVNVFREDLVQYLEGEQQKVSNSSARHKFYQEMLDMLHSIKIVAF